MSCILFAALDVYSLLSLYSSINQTSGLFSIVQGLKGHRLSIYAYLCLKALFVMYNKVSVWYTTRFYFNRCWCKGITEGAKHALLIQATHHWHFSIEQADLFFSRTKYLFAESKRCNGVHIFVLSRMQCDMRSDKTPSITWSCILTSLEQHISNAHFHPLSHLVVCLMFHMVYPWD